MEIKLKLFQWFFFRTTAIQIHEEKERKRYKKREKLPSSILTSLHTMQRIVIIHIILYRWQWYKRLCLPNNLTPDSNPVLKRDWEKITTNHFMTWIIVLNQFLLFTLFLAILRMLVKCLGYENKYFIGLNWKYAQKNRNDQKTG